DASGDERRDEPVVRDTALAARGGQTRNPQRAEMPLLLLPVAGGVTLGPHRELDRRAIQRAEAAAKTLRGLHYLLLLFGVLDATLRARHENSCGETSGFEISFWI